MPNTKFLDACRILKTIGDHDYVDGTMPELLDLSHNFEKAKVFESDEHKEAIYSLFTTLVVCVIVRVALYGDLPSQKPGGVFILGDFFRLNNASEALMSHLSNLLHNDDLTVDYSDKVYNDAWRELAETLNTPRARAWRRTFEVLKAAMNDPAIAVNQDAVDYLSTMCKSIGAVSGGKTLNDVLHAIRHADKSKIGLYGVQVKKEKSAPKIAACIKAWAEDSNGKKRIKQGAWAGEYAQREGLKKTTVEKWLRDSKDVKN